MLKLRKWRNGEIFQMAEEKLHNDEIARSRGFILLSPTVQLYDESWQFLSQAVNTE